MPQKVQIKRTSTPGAQPTGLLPGELSIEMGTPTRLWVGVPPAIDAAEKKLLIDLSVVGGVVVSDTPPVSPTQGMLWLESDTMTLWISYEDPNGMQWVQVNGVSTGSGDVVGPPNAVHNNVAAFDGVTGKLIKDSGKVIDGFLAIPMFYAERNTTQSAVPNAWTKVTGLTASVDTHGAFINSERFAPTVAGWYQIFANLHAGMNQYDCGLQVWKNGVMTNFMVTTSYVGFPSTAQMQVNAMLHLDPGEYVELYGIHGHTTSTWFVKSGFWAYRLAL